MRKRHASQYANFGSLLTFSYKMREGVARNMNACFLMEKMGLVIND